MVWSIGGTCDSDGRILFDTFLRDIVLGKLEDHPVPTALGKWDCPFEERGLVYDYMFEVCVYNAMCNAIELRKAVELVNTWNLIFYVSI